ncbi:Hsp70 family protein, partial [Candidatus Parcubacteria bacterium]|nr:Hsp70 family protein [Candidatus Parcubacteria bacterium]
PSEIEEVILVGGQTRMPKIVERVKEYFGREPHQGVNPDEVVAVGAAVQAGVLSGEAQDVLLLDVTPLTLGIETLGGIRTPLIERNTTVPTGKSQIFSTAADSQTSVEINVLQGEREMASDNKPLGRFILDGIPPAPRGMPQVEVKFDIDSNGILNVSAKDKASGKEQSIKITGSTGLSKDEVEKMTVEAEKHAEEDRIKKEQVEARNLADNLCYTAEKSLKDASDKVSEDIKKEIEEKVKAIRDILATASAEELKTKTEDLSQSMQKIGEQLNKQQQDQPQAGGPQPGQGSGGGGRRSPEASAEGEEKKDDQEPQEGEIVKE